MIGLAGEQIIQLAILMPLVASVLIVLAGKRPNLREAITLITAVMVALLVMTLAGQVNAGETKF